MINFKEWRLNKNLSQTKAALLFGVPRTTYQMWEYGRSTPKNSTLIRVEKIMEHLKQQNINEAVDRLEALKSYQKIEQYWEKYSTNPEEVSLPKAKLKYIILFAIILFSLIILY